MECVHCLAGARCSGFDRQTGDLFAPIAKAGWYGLRMCLSKDGGGTRLPRYVFHKCKPGRCLEVTALVRAIDENSHVHTFSNLSGNALSRCAPNLEGFLCNRCKPGTFRLLPSSSTCQACFLQDAPELGKILSLAILLFLMFAFVPLFRRIRTAIPSLYSIIPFLQIFALMKAQLGFSWPAISGVLSFPASVFAINLNL